jgi:hypothetical protein
MISYIYQQRQQPQQYNQQQERQYRQQEQQHNQRQHQQPHQYHPQQLPFERNGGDGQSQEGQPISTQPTTRVSIILFNKQKY